MEVYFKVYFFPLARFLEVYENWERTFQTRIGLTFYKSYRIWYFSAKVLTVSEMRNISNCYKVGGNYYSLETLLINVSKNAHKH